MYCYEIFAYAYINFRCTAGQFVSYSYITKYNITYKTLPFILYCLWGSEGLVGANMKKKSYLISSNIYNKDKKLSVTVYAYVIHIAVD